jgi:vacuolar-type H+-ATPase subunit I/STV1
MFNDTDLSRQNDELKTSKLEVLTDRIEQKEATLEQLKNQRRAILNREKKALSKAAKKLEDRRKVLIGAMLMGEFVTDKNLESEIISRLEKWLERDDERAAFGFEPLSGDVKQKLTALKDAKK